jgi:hypothetical protein
MLKWHQKKELSEIALGTLKTGLGPLNTDIRGTYALRLHVGTVGLSSQAEIASLAKTHSSSVASSVKYSVLLFPRELATFE